VDGEYRLLGRFDAGFIVTGRDASRPLAIDPVLESSTFFGGSGDDTVIATSGISIAGTTTSIDVPGSALSRPKGIDIFVSLNNGYTDQIMVIGGSGNEQVTSVAFAPAYGYSSIVIGGYTDSRNLPSAAQISARTHSPHGSGSIRAARPMDSSW